MQCMPCMHGEYALIETKLKNLLIEGQKFENANDLRILGLQHRLLQHPLYCNNAKVNRPIIFKLESSYEKQLNMNSLKHLKVYNEYKPNVNSDAAKIYNYKITVKG